MRRSAFVRLEPLRRRLRSRAVSGASPDDVVDDLERHRPVADPLDHDRFVTRRHHHHCAVAHVEARQLDHRAHATQFTLERS